MTEANRALSRKHTGHSEHPLPTTQETTLHMDIATWSIVKTDWLYSLQLKMENFNTVSKNKTWSWLWLRSWGPNWKIQSSTEESREKHKAIKIWSKSNPLCLYSGSDEQIQGIRSGRQSAWRTMDRGSWNYRRQWPKLFPQKINARKQSGCLRRLYK